MTLARLVYFSRPNTIGDADIEAILTKSLTNNYLKNITGALFYNGQWFVQVLEGGRLALSELFARIAWDKRHREVCLLDVTPIAERRFADWDMRYIGGSSEQEAVIKRFMPDGFDPTLVSDGATMARILAALADAGAAHPEPAPRATPPA